MIEYFILILFSENFQMTIIPFRSYELCAEVLYHLTFETTKESGQCGKQEVVPMFEMPPKRPETLASI